MRKIMVFSFLFLFRGVKTLRFGFRLENAEKGKHDQCENEIQQWGLGKAKHF